jgi:hypothetical protein
LNFTNAEAALRGGFFFFKVSPDVSQPSAPYGDRGAAPPESCSYLINVAWESVRAPTHYLELGSQPFRIVDLSQEKVILRVAHKKKQETVA